jgi:transcriptional regulator with XRE-family HTH domain
MKKTPKVSQVLRQAMKDSGQTMYALAKGSGLSYAIVWRFISGERTLSQGAIDQMAEYLQLQLVPMRRPKRKPTKTT